MSLLDTQVIATPASPDPLYDDFALTERLMQLYSLARTEKKKYQANWRRNYLLTTNKQYSLDTQSPWTPNVTDSEIWPILSSRISWMTDQKIQPNVAPAALPGDPYAQHVRTLSEHMEQLFESEFKNQGWDKEIILALWDAAQFGAGVFKSVWDSGLEEGLGNVSLKRVDVWNFYPDPNAHDLESCTYMFEVEKMTFDQIQRRFPSADIESIRSAYLYGQRGDDIVRPSQSSSSQYPMAMPGNLPGSTSTTWGLPGQSSRSTDQILAEGVNVYTCWLLENWQEERDPTDATHSGGKPPGTLHSPTERVVYDEWRCVVYTGNVVLFDELATDLWEHSRHPYTRYVDEEMGEFWPTPIVSHLAPCQVAINRLLASLQGNVELVGNPIFIDVADSGLARTANVNRPGQKLIMNARTANSQGQKPMWLEPPKMQSDVQNLIQFWITRMENISGLSGVQKGQQPKDRQAAQTMQATQEAGFVRIRSSIRNLERTLGESYRLLAHLIVQNFDVPRIMAIVGPDGTDSAMLLASKHFYSPSIHGTVAPMKFSLLVAAGADNPTSRQARIAEADALAALNMIDRPAVLEQHAFPHWQSIDQRMQQKEMAIAQAQAEGQAAGRRGGGGKPQPRGPGTGHAH
jgi:hypothetical protein